MRAQVRQKSGPRIKPVGRSIFLSSVFGYFFGNAKSIKHKKRKIPFQNSFLKKYSLPLYTLKTVAQSNQLNQLPT